jgi:DNA polymerase-4
MEKLAIAGMRASVAEGWRRRLRGFEVSSFELAARKSYSHSHVMARPTASQHELEDLLMRLSDMVGRRLRSGGRRGSIVSVGIVYRPDTVRFSRQSKMPVPVVTGEEIYQAARSLLGLRDPAQQVGTLGVGLSGLSAADQAQLDLFADPKAPRSERLEAAMDKIRDRFGEDAVQRSRLLGHAQVVRDRIAFGNTGHPDDRKSG